MRESRGWSQSQVVDLARRRKLPGLSLQQLRYLEEGRTKHPEAETLRSIAALYSLQYEELVARFVEASYGAIAPLGAPTADPISGGEWRLLMPSEQIALEEWRGSSPDGRKSALAVLRVARPHIVKGKQRRIEDVGPPPGVPERRERQLPPRPRPVEAAKQKRRA